MFSMTHIHYSIISIQAGVAQYIAGKQIILDRLNHPSFDPVVLSHGNS